MKPASRNGYSLLEIALVMTIVSLIIGSVFAGQALIRSAQVNSIVTDISRYTQAITEFRDKYQSYPGDLPNAQFYWGNDPGGCPAVTSGASPTPWNPLPHKETCNGDGNGLIGQLGTLDSGGFVAAGPGAYEWYRAWQHLADAGMIEGSYSGMSGPAGANNAVLGKNVPASRLSGAGFSLFYASYPAGSADWWPILDHVIVFGRVAGTGWTSGAALKPEEAFAIDSKTDDGIPATGKVQTLRQSQLPNCDSTDVQTTAKYNTAFKSEACNLIFDLGF